MKKTLILLFVIALTLCSCQRADTQHITPVQKAFSETENTDYSFILRVELSGKLCVLLAQGDISFSEDPLTVTGEIEETLFGDNLGIMQIEWQDGILTSDGHEDECSWEEFQSSMIYAPPVIFTEEQIRSTEMANTFGGTTYRHEVKDNSNGELLYSLLGEALPGICGVSSVVREDTRFENIRCEYTVDEEGNPAGYNLFFTVYYQDEPPYIPGVKPDKDEYTVAVSVEYRVSYK